MLYKARHNLLLDFCITLLLCYYLTRHPLGKAGISTKRENHRLIVNMSTGMTPDERKLAPIYGMSIQLPTCLSYMSPSRRRKSRKKGRLTA
jgi:hypothetical protein